MAKIRARYIKYRWKWFKNVQMVLEIDSIPINMIPCHAISGFTAGGYLSTPLRVQSTSRVQCVKMKFSNL